MLTLSILLAAALLLLLYGAFSNNFCDTNRLTGLAALIAAVPLVLQPHTGALFVTADGPMLLLTPASNLVWLALLLFTPFALALTSKSNAALAKPEYPLLVLLSVTGMLILSSAHDFLSFYVGLELMSFPLYILCAFNRSDARSAESGLKYFVLGALASGLFLYGVSLFYATTGSTNFTAALSAAGTLGSQPLAAVSLALILVATLFKLSAAPFHVWTPDVYEGAPTPTTAILGTLPKLAVLAILMRLLAMPFATLATLWQPTLMLVAVLSMVFGSAVAIIQTDLKRLLAYSTIGNIGFILVGVATATPESNAGVLFYALVYLINTLGLFAFLIALGKPQPIIEDLKGLVKTRPWLTAAFILQLFSLAGVPPLAGFMGKLNVFLPAVTAGHTTLVIIAVGASVIALFYSLSLIRHAVFAEGQGNTKPAKISSTLQLVLITTSVATLVLGLFPQPLLALLKQTTAALF